MVLINKLSEADETTNFTIQTGDILEAKEN